MADGGQTNSSQAQQNPITRDEILALMSSVKKLEKSISDNQWLWWKLLGASILGYYWVDIMDFFK